MWKEAMKKNLSSCRKIETVGIDAKLGDIDRREAGREYRVAPIEELERFSKQRL